MFNQLGEYRNMALDLVERGKEGDMGTTEIIGYNYRIDPYNPWFALEERKLKVPFIMKELIWYLEGDRSAKWIGDHAKVWRNVIEHDRMAVSNYGYQAFARHSLAKVVGLLRNEPKTRRAIIYFGENAHVVSHDYKKDQSCANSIHWMVRDGILHTIVSQRSQDYIYGVSGDAVFMTMLTNIVARMLNVDMAPILVQVASFHHYPKHKDMVNRLLNSEGYTIEWRYDLLKKKEANNLMQGKHVGPFYDWIKEESR